MALTDITRSEVAQAIEECDRLGRERFLQRHGFKPATRYLLSHQGTLYDSKAIVGVAHGSLPGQEPLAAGEFSGGVHHAVALLRNLGFTVVDRSESPWDPTEELLHRIGQLKVNRASGRPLLYQPITLLWAVGRARHAEDRLLPWDVTVEALGGLLRRHGLRPRPDYPIAALHSTDLWDLPDHPGSVPSAHGDSTLKRWFADHRPRSGPAETAYDLLRRSGEARIAVVDTLLSTYFVGIDGEPLLHQVGLHDEIAGYPPEEEPAPADPVVFAAQYDRLCRLVERRENANQGRRIPAGSSPYRSAAARRAVLLRSLGRCENPHCAGQPADVTTSGAPILEIDHITELGDGGRDHPSVMIALCPNCHAVKTRGRGREELRAILRAVAAERHTAWAEPHR